MFYIAGSTKKKETKKKKIGKLESPQNDPERLPRNPHLQVLMERMEAINQQLRNAKLKCVKLIRRNSG